MVDQYLVDLEHERKAINKRTTSHPSPKNTSQLNLDTRPCTSSLPVRGTPALAVRQQPLLLQLVQKPGRFHLGAIRIRTLARDFGLADTLQVGLVAESLGRLK